MGICVELEMVTCGQVKIAFQSHFFLIIMLDMQLKGSLLMIPILLSPSSTMLIALASKVVLKCPILHLASHKHSKIMCQDPHNHKTGLKIMRCFFLRRKQIIWCSFYLPLAFEPLRITFYRFLLAIRRAIILLFLLNERGASIILF